MSLRDTTLTDLEIIALDATAADSVALQLDEETFRGFYDRTAQMLWAYLFRLTGDRSAADDLLQDAYYRFLRSGLALDSESHRRHYLFRVATNLAIDRARRRGRRPEHGENGLQEVGAGGASDALDRRLDVAQALARLRWRDRAMLWLAYAQGASHEEIARIVGIGAGSVKPLLYRARRRMAALLRGHGGQP
jgi:RNA polymerase sigma-70 factor (ECF subfamily)